jgi:hypothetical protein
MVILMLWILVREVQDYEAKKKLAMGLALILAIVANAGVWEKRRYIIRPNHRDIQ